MYTQKTQSIHQHRKENSHSSYFLIYTITWHYAVVLHLWSAVCPLSNTSFKADHHMWLQILPTWADSPSAEMGRNRQKNSLSLPLHVHLSSDHIPARLPHNGEVLLPHNEDTRLGTSAVCEGAETKQKTKNGIVRVEVEVRFSISSKKNSFT